MRINLSKIGKRYRSEWIFRGVNYSFEEGLKYAISGHNGAGKSTFLRVLSGHLTPTKGKITFQKDKQKLLPEDTYRHLAFAAPYIDLIEEFSLEEAVNFQGKFKPFETGVGIDKIIDILQLPNAKNKEIRNFSSGMKQRLKLVLAICSGASLVLLDEPTTNLDRQGVQWYLDLIENHTQNKTVIIASNVLEDFNFCQHSLDITAYKKKSP